MYMLRFVPWDVMGGSAFDEWIGDTIMALLCCFPTDKRHNPDFSIKRAPNIIGWDGPGRPDPSGSSYF